MIATLPTKPLTVQCVNFDIAHHAGRELGDIIFEHRDFDIDAAEFGDFGSFIALHQPLAHFGELRRNPTVEGREHGMAIELFAEAFDLGLLNCDAGPPLFALLFPGIAGQQAQDCGRIILGRLRLCCSRLSGFFEGFFGDGVG